MSSIVSKYDMYVLHQINYFSES